MPTRARLAANAELGFGGAKPASARACACMTNHVEPQHRGPDALDELVTHLLGCGGALSPMISHVVAFEASGKGAADAAPIPEVAHALIRGVLGSVAKQHSKRDVRIAARIAEQVTDQICEEISLVPPEFVDAAQNQGFRRDRRPGCKSGSSAERARIAEMPAARDGVRALVRNGCTGAANSL